MQMILEKMDEFFNSRLEGYEEHQLNAIEGSKEFYPYTASLLPRQKGARILDLGCGTGLELDYYFAYNPKACVTGIDLAADMIAVLLKKFAGKNIGAIIAPYFDVPFWPPYYDAVVAVESMHHLTKPEKVLVYRKALKVLCKTGYFILTDYFATSNEEENAFRQEFVHLKAEQGIDDNEYYHYDTPLTVEHEMEALKEAGFTSVKLLRRWGATCTIKADK